jgi:hypothetical protein
MRLCTSECAWLKQFSLGKGRRFTKEGDHECRTISLDSVSAPRLAINDSTSATYTHFGRADWILAAGFIAHDLLPCFNTYKLVKRDGALAQDKAGTHPSLESSRPLSR